MKDVITKYAKDLQKGDKINGHCDGWITVLSAERIPLTHYTKIIFDGYDPQIMDSHTIFESVYTERGQA